MITIANSVFDVQGTSTKDSKTPGITLSGSEDILIKDCTFVNKGYSSILNHCTGKVTVENCVFECDNVYNPIEGSQNVNNGNVVVKGCSFNGKPGNNFINFYQVAEGSEHLVANCSFSPSVDNNIIRISNKTSAATQVVVKDCEYTFLPGDATEYTNFLLCQDYTSKSGVKQDFTGVSVVLDNVVCDGVKLDVENGAVKGGVFYVYEDGKGLITGTGNDPIVIIK